MKIKHYKHTQIDFQKWDNAIDTAKNGLVYAKSWYLDIVSPRWEALIVGDYEWIMPLPVKNKFGVKYLVQPVLTQQLGLFSKEKIEEQTIYSFIQKIPYISYELHLNEQNRTSKASERVNLLLYLSRDYSNLQQGFSKNCLRNIDLATKSRLRINKDLSAQEFLNFYYTTETNFSKPNETICRKLIKKGVENKSISLYGIKNERSEILAAFCLLYSGNRLINLLPISTAEGKKKSAMFLLVNEIIKSYAGSCKIIDFEGSMIEGVARFYKNFGADVSPYFLIKRFRPKFLLGKL